MARADPETDDRNFRLVCAGVPAGFFELDIAAARETKLSYFGLIPDFIGRPPRPLSAAGCDRSGLVTAARSFWLHTSTFDHPKALRVYSRLVLSSTRAARIVRRPAERGILAPR